MIEACTTFILMAALDFVWAHYTRAIQARAAALAGGLSALIFLLNGAVTLAYVKDPWMLIPAVFGAALGTYLGTKR